MRESVHSQRGAGEDTGCDGEGEEAISDGSGVDEVFPLEHPDSEND